MRTGEYWFPKIEALGRSVNTASSRSYAGVANRGYGHPNPRLNLTSRRGMLVVPARPHSGYHSRAALGIPVTLCGRAGAWPLGTVTTPVGPDALGPGRSATFDASPGKAYAGGAPTRFHSGFANPSVSLWVLVNSPRRAGVWSLGRVTARRGPGGHRTGAGFRELG